MSQFAFYDFQFGILKIAYTDSTVTFLKKVTAIDEQNKPSALSDMVFTQVQEYFEGNRKHFDFPYELHGTDFQKKVWAALCTIPYGKTCTYKDIATIVGNPKASRAVGMANNKNPITIAVPCHRVIGSSGKLIGYAGGLTMKEAMIALEQRT